MILGFCGFISSGKDTAADYLVEHHNFIRESFASNLKDIISVVFGWDRDWLEGRTKSAREWREQPDQWWSTRLGFSVTPRYMLQYWGTDILRNHFHNDIWIASLEHKLLQNTKNIVITDCRFPNEISAIRSLGGKVVRIVRGPEPIWLEDAKTLMRGPERNIGWALARQSIEQKRIHPSEYSWVNTEFDAIIKNNDSITELYTQIEKTLHQL